MKKHNFKCHYCHSDFSPIHYNCKYCSKTCRDVAQIMRHQQIAAWPEKDDSNYLHQQKLDTQINQRWLEEDL